MEFKVFFLNLLILFCLALLTNADEEKVPQIKAVGVQVKYLDPAFQTDVVYTVRKLNETFNYLTIFWDLKVDPPADTTVYLKVYVTDSTYQNGTLILNVATPICKPSKERELLPSILQVHERLLNTQCLKRGTHKVENLVQYRFEVLVPNIESLGSYYRAEYTFGNEVITFGIVHVYNEWGYLHCN